MRKIIPGRIDILIGIGIIGILLLALAGTGSAHSVYGSVVGSNCAACHSGIPALNANGILFKENHKFNGLTEPLTSTASCTYCHTNLATGFLPFTSNGSFYNSTHRYNDTTLASARLAPPASCYSCHVNVSAGNFALISGVPATYLKSTTCENCHKSKYDNWRGTMHRVMLTDNSTAQGMGLPTPPNLTWTDMSYVIVGKQELRYLNESGYLFKRFFAENGTSADYGPSQYTCGRCHTTGYNASNGNQSGLPGIVGTWSEPGIACERCHGPAGDGHQVKADVSEQLCLECHNGSTRQGLFLSSAHSPPLKAPATCLRCHSPFDYARNNTVTSDTAINVVCANCHNSHDTSDNKYRELFSPGGFNQTSYADMKDAKNSLFNSTASRLLITGGPTGTLTGEKDVYDTLMTPASIPTDRIDDSYPGPIEVTGPVSEVLCSNCHYEHGLSHIAEVNLTHARLNYPGLGLPPATCTDCHMSGTQKNHSFNVKDEVNFPSKTCSRGTQCHVTSDQNLNHSIFSLVPEVNEWRQSLHNEKANGGFYLNSTGVPRERESSCSKCHSPSNWNPLNERAIVSADDFNGITCAVCHNIHDMGDWLKKTGKPYAWYNRDAIPVFNTTGDLTRYKANYSVMENTTELCGNCHSNDSPRIFREGPGWNNTNDTTPIRPHGLPAKDIFAGSWKQTNLGFECISCHMATKVTDPTNMTEMVLPDSQKVKGHSFKVNVDLLQSNTTCAGCHTTGSQPGNLSDTIEKIQADTRAKWNVTNTTVTDALGTINAFAGEKNQSRNMIADAYWKLQMVSSEGSWGVHNPVKVNNMLNESSNEANAAVQALGPGNQTGNQTFTANLSGSEEVPPVITEARGQATFILDNDTVHFTLAVSNITNATLSHIHLAPVGQNGPIVALLYPGPTKTESFDGVLAQGNITAENLTGPLAGMPLSALIDNMTAGNTYANVHTVQNPGGEIRGQIKTAVSVTPTFSISGFKLDNNGTGLANWNITLTKPDNTVMDNVTDASGMYQFMNLSNGTYTINEQMHPGWTNVSAMPVQVTINGADVMNQNITNRQVQPGETFKISGFKLDNNGTGLANWNITLTKPDNTVMDNVTDASGMYQFMNLPGGTYTVAEQMQPGWTNVSAMSIQVTIAGSDMMNQNFTNTIIIQQPNVTSFELTPDRTAALSGGTITITVKALNVNTTDTSFNGMASITVNASKNASAVIYPPNVTFSNGVATLPVSSNIAQFVTVTATNGKTTGSTDIAFADMVFDLDPGWNLISIPNFANPDSVDMILKNVKNNGLVGYDPGNKTFSTPADLQPLYGYWINVTASNQSIGFIADTNVGSTPPPGRDLFEGWNLIGVVASKQEQEQNKQLDAGLLFQPLQIGGKPLYSYLVSYKNPRKTYTVGDDLTDRTPLNKGQGYWLFMNTLTDTNKDTFVWGGRAWLPGSS
ncbi:MAG: ammonia-forming cytochrome c nitrite reductase subunit c552 [Candidatus Methanoperedens sp.]|nr:ammonia-forming cytochrome c nitrite reductase subunit c552 [Candidatus Methanoperedens sp.]